MRARSRLAAAFSACVLAVACALADDDYSSGLGASGTQGGTVAAGGSASGHAQGGTTAHFPDGGTTVGAGGTSVGFPDGGAVMGGGTAGGGGAAGGGGMSAAGTGPAVGAGGMPMGTGGTGTATGAGGSPPAPFCGDGIKDANEACDTGDFAGATCESVLGRPGAGGPLVCGPGCQIDTSGCVYCGDGAPNNGENCNSCPSDTGACCTSRCCDGSITATTGETGSDNCRNTGAALCGGAGLARSTWNGAEVYPSYCQIKCVTFTTWHNVGAPDLDPPNCSHDKAVAYCAPHGGYKDGNIAFTACPM